MVDVGRCAAIHRIADGGMLHELILFVHHRPCAADEQDAIPVIQHPHLVRRQQFSAAHLEVSGVRPGPPFGLPVSLGVNGGLTQRLRNVLVSACLVAAQIEQRVRVARDGFPGILIQLLNLRHVLDDGAAGDIAGAHGRKLPRQPRQIDRWRFVQDKVDMTRQCPMVDLVGAVVQCLEYLGVQQADEEVEGRVIIRDHGIQSALSLSQRVEIHVIMVGDSFDLRQIEGRQPHSGTHQNAFRCLASNKMSIVF